MISDSLFRVVEDYPSDHPFHELLLLSKKHKFTEAYFVFLDTAIKTVEAASPKAAEDFLIHKLAARHGDHYDQHALFAALCELSVLNSFIVQSGDPEAFIYEPKPVKGSNKNPEFSTKVEGITYFVEVKSMNYPIQREKLERQFEERKVVRQYDARILPLTEEEKRESITSTDVKVKDFLVDANKKFAKSNAGDYVNVLFICWSDETDQPATALKSHYHGLLTEKSWFRDQNGKVITFENIDAIFISDVYYNHGVHMATTDVPLPGILTGVPYFENAFPQMPNPFLLPFSRNVFVEMPIDPYLLYPLPISTPDRPVEVITEEFVRKYCPEIKFHSKY